MSLSGPPPPSLQEGSRRGNMQVNGLERSVSNGGLGRSVSNGGSKRKHTNSAGPSMPQPPNDQITNYNNYKAIKTKKKYRAEQIKLYNKALNEIQKVSRPSRRTPAAAAAAAVLPGVQAIINEFKNKESIKSAINKLVNQQEKNKQRIAHFKTTNKYTNGKETEKVREQARKRVKSGNNNPYTLIPDKYTDPVTQRLFFGLIKRDEKTNKWVMKHIREQKINPQITYGNYTIKTTWNPLDINDINIILIRVGEENIIQNIHLNVDQRKINKKTFTDGISVDISALGNKQTWYEIATNGKINIFQKESAKGSISVESLFLLEQKLAERNFKTPSNADKLFTAVYETNIIKYSLDQGHRQLTNEIGIGVGQNSPYFKGVAIGGDILLNRALNLTKKYIVELSNQQNFNQQVRSIGNPSNIVTATATASGTSAASVAMVPAMTTAAFAANSIMQKLQENSNMTYKTMRYATEAAHITLDKMSGFLTLLKDNQKGRSFNHGTLIFLSKKQNIHEFYIFKREYTPASISKPSANELLISFKSWVDTTTVKSDDFSKRFEAKSTGKPDKKWYQLLNLLTSLNHDELSNFLKIFEILHDFFGDRGKNFDKTQRLKVIETLAGNDYNKLNDILNLEETLVEKEKQKNDHPEMLAYLFNLYMCVYYDSSVLEPTNIVTQTLWTNDINMTIPNSKGLLRKPKVDVGKHTLWNYLVNYEYIIPKRAILFLADVVPYPTSYLGSNSFNKRLNQQSNSKKRQTFSKQNEGSKPYISLFHGTNVNIPNAPNPSTSD